LKTFSLFITISKVLAAPRPRPGGTMKLASWIFGADGALFRAAARGDAALIEELIASGANVNAASRRGYTPLHRAAQNGNTEAVALLLKKGANAEAATIEGLTPLEMARMNGHRAAAALLSNHSSEPKKP